MLPIIKTIAFMSGYIFIVGSIVFCMINLLRKRMLKPSPLFVGVVIAMSTILGVFRQQRPSQAARKEELVRRSTTTNKNKIN